MSAYRAVARTFTVSLRSAPAARSVALRSPVSARRWASSASPNSFPQLPPGFEKLAHSPSALSAITNLVEVMKANGVDLHTGEKPSMWQMMKLARNQEVRDATTKVMEELKNAGVDVSPERLQAIMNSQKDIFGGNKDGNDGGKSQ
ncbi:hypothetical protein PANT_6c00129 [Moesziomyces antarcticus T-34]|uniref:Uncharacterized protein n=1 Tax=Pseudozyma antarctica (strain T-34) TaxID=1151754 RepID=M9MB66_PSEA3|nr:hypothetical protein PANT_6c00129 [Moesziomyces antarcticus T-34]